MQGDTPLILAEEPLTGRRKALRTKTYERIPCSQMESTWVVTMWHGPFSDHLGQVRPSQSGWPARDDWSRGCLSRAL